MYNDLAFSRESNIHHLRLPNVIDLTDEIDKVNEFFQNNDVSC